MKLETKDQQFRGTFLYWAANIDRYLTGMIAWHFFPDDIYKRKMLVGHIISDINLDKKIRIFFNLVNTYHKEIINNHPKLSDHFKKIRELRNKLAHARLDTSLDYLRTKSTNIRLEIW